MRLQELAERFGLELRGKPDHLIDGVGTLMRATPSQISFLANPAYTSELENTRAGAVLVEVKNAERCRGNVLVAKDPYLAYARIASLFQPAVPALPGIHESAEIDASVTLGRNVSIAANVVIGAHSVIGDGCVLQAGVVIGPNCELGEACLLYPNVTLQHAVRLGKRVILHPGVVIGADGFGIAFANDSAGAGHWEKVPQLGSVRIGDDCEIGANSTVDRGAIEDTVLEEDVRIDNQVQIGHNVQIGAHTAIAGAAAIAGSARIGRYCMIAGKAGVNGHVTIADRTTIGAASNVMRDIEEAGTTWDSHIPAQPIRAWQRILSRLLKLETLHKRLSELEKTQMNDSSRKPGNND